MHRGERTNGSSLLQLRVGRQPQCRQGLVIAPFGADGFGMPNRQLGIGLIARLRSPEPIYVIVMKLREPLWGCAAVPFEFVEASSCFAMGGCFFPQQAGFVISVRIRPHQLIAAIGWEPGVGPFGHGFGISFRVDRRTGASAIRVGIP
jgi:hypothetical protein